MPAKLVTYNSQKYVSTLGSGLCVVQTAENDPLFITDPTVYNLIASYLTTCC